VTQATKKLREVILACNLAVRLSLAMADAIAAFGDAHGLSHSEAMRELIRLGLEAVARKAPWALSSKESWRQTGCNVD
jgi:hypothetical protein